MCRKLNRFTYVNNWLESNAPENYRLKTRTVGFPLIELKR